MSLDEQDTEDTPLGDARTNCRRGSCVEVEVENGGALFYRPETHELLVVPGSDQAAFEGECRLLDKLAFDLSSAKEAFQIAQDAWIAAEQAACGPRRTCPANPNDLFDAQARVDQAQAEVEQAQRALNEEFEPLGQLTDADTRLYEIIPVLLRGSPRDGAGTAAQRNGHTWARKWTYVRSEKVRNHFRGYQLNAEEQSIYQPLPEAGGDGPDAARRNIDWNKVREDINSLETSVKWRKELEPVQGVMLEDANAAIRRTLQGWAQGVNSGNEGTRIEPQFQLLRYFAGAGIQTNWDPKKGNVALRADARGEFSIAEGKFSAAAYLPNQAGWMLAMTGPRSGNVHEIGQLRFGLAFELSGLAGASACGQLGVQVDYTSAMAGQAAMRGKPADRRRNVRQRVVNVTEDLRDGAEVVGGIDLFAGVRADGSVKGAIEWNSPEDQEFKKLADIGPGIGLQAGAGLSGTFVITYEGGKFRFLVAASLCWGAGAAGKLSFEVDAEHTFEMAKYLAHMLYNVGYEYVEIIAGDAFDAWKNLSLWAVQTGQTLVVAASEFGDEIMDAYMDVSAKLEREAERIQLMERVLAEPAELEFSPPESKGMILWQLTRHGRLTKALPANYDWTSRETLGRRKRSIITLFRKVRSRAEFRNVLQHMTRDGSSDARGWEENLRQVKDFLDYGIAPNDYEGELQDLHDQLLGSSSGLGNTIDSTYLALHDVPVRGHPFVDNTSLAYRSRSGKGHHDGFLVAGGYTPGSPLPTDLSEGESRFV